MKTKRLWLGMALLFILSACILPVDFLLDGDENTPETTIKEEIQELLEFGKEKSAPEIFPADQLAAADGALFAGEIEKARLEYQAAFSSSDDPELQARSLYGIGRTYFLERDYYAAIDAFNRILGQFPDTDEEANAYFLLGQVYQAIGENEQAINAYSSYIERKPGFLNAHVYETIGDISMQMQDYERAIISYQSAQLADAEFDKHYINLQIGKAYGELKDLTTAIQYYENVYVTVEDDYTRSTANLLAGQAYLGLDLENEAYTKFLDSVIKYPKAYDSFTALTILINDGVPVDDFLRGVVDYYAGSYNAAVKAFQSYLDSNPDNNDGTAYYFLGLSHYFAGNPRSAVSAYEELIAGFPGNAYWPNAWDEKAYVQWALLNEYSAAADTLVSFVNAAPGSPDAPAYLYEAGRILERSGDLEGASAIWQRMMNDYPSFEQSYRALFLAGVSYFRLSRYEEALSIFQRALVLATSPDEKAKAYLWIGKCYEKLGQSTDAENAWRQGEVADPTDYYSIRSSEILKGLAPLEMDATYDLGYDLHLERDEADQWMRTTFNIPAETNLTGLGILAIDPALERIREYHALGLYQEAASEAEDLRESVSTDVVSSYQLMNFLIDLHLYQQAIYACRNILNLAGLDDLSSLSAPIYFTHIRFGAYFRELTLNAANENGIPPLLLFSLIRQESLFNPYIYSAAGASGLAQIMPATGQENANLLKWPQNYEQIDLQRGEVSVTLGAYYLSLTREYLNGTLQAALAGYNAGPGNAEVWLSLADNDPDLFLEVIRAQETQNYLMQITEFLNIYKLVYSRMQ